MSINPLSSKDPKDLNESSYASQLQKNRPHCAWCGKVVGRRAITHSNPAFTESKISFCSVDCHNQWCYAQASKSQS